MAGLDIFGEGGEKVRELLGDDIMHSEVITHSYPYDWRTKKPVFLRASKQWFINTDQLKSEAMKVLERVKVQPDTAGNGFRQRQFSWDTKSLYTYVCYMKVTRNGISNFEFRTAICFI